MRDAGALLLNQSVLLRGVNDDVEVLAALSERLFEVGVLPYYLHQLDRVAGAAHFEVDDTSARRLHVGVAVAAARVPGAAAGAGNRGCAGKDSAVMALTARASGIVLSYSSQVIE